MDGSTVHPRKLLINLQVLIAKLRIPVRRRRGAHLLLLCVCSVCRFVVCVCGFVLCEDVSVKNRPHVSAWCSFAACAGVNV